MNLYIFISIDNYVGNARRQVPHQYLLYKAASKAYKSVYLYVLYFSRSSYILVQFESRISIGRYLFFYIIRLDTYTDLHSNGLHI